MGMLLRQLSSAHFSTTVDQLLWAERLTDVIIDFGDMNTKHFIDILGFRGDPR